MIQEIRKYLSMHLRVAISLGVLGLVFFTFFFFDQSKLSYIDIEGDLLESGYDASRIDGQLTLGDAELKEFHKDNPARLSLNEYSVGDASRRGIAVDAGEYAVFYPFGGLSHYEVINDIIAGQPILVAYCSTCETAVIADRVIDGEEYQFRATGYLWDGGLLMQSKSSGGAAYWSAASGEELRIDEPRMLNFLSFEILTFEEFELRHPDGKVAHL